MEDTRARILKSALETFSKQGYSGATTRELARRADVTEVTLFRHFQSKEKLFEEVVCGFLPGPDFGQIIADAKKLGFKEALESIAYAFLGGLKQHEDLIQVLYMEYHRHYELMDKVYDALINNLTKLVANYFKELQDKGLIRAFNPVIGAKMFLGSWVSFYEEELLFNKDRPGEDIEEAVPVCVDIFVRGTQL